VRASLLSDFSSAGISVPDEPNINPAQISTIASKNPKRRNNVKNRVGNGSRRSIISYHSIPHLSMSYNIRIYARNNRGNYGIFLKTVFLCKKEHFFA
jgi:hypothetical protein